VKAAPTYKFLPPELAGCLGNLGLSVRKPVEGSLQGLHRSPHLGSSVEFAEYRQYVRGDPIQNIDWAVYARSDRYVIRCFQEETNLRAYILLDKSESLKFREQGIHSKMDYASFLAAALMFILVNQGDSVSLVTFDEKVTKVFAPVGSFEGLRPLLLYLEDIRPSGHSEIESAMHDAANMISSKSLVILISDLLQGPAQILRGIRHLQHDGHDVTVLHIMDRAELRLGFTGLTKIMELETGRKMVIDVEDIRNAYTVEVERHIDGLRQGCVDCQAEYHFIDTRTPLVDALHQRVTTS